MWGKKKIIKLDEDDKPIPVKLADKDKIFNNSYGDQDVTQNRVNFTVSASYGDSMDPDDRMHYEILIGKIDKIIKGSEYEHLNEATPEATSLPSSMVERRPVR